MRKTLEDTVVSEKVRKTYREEGLWSIVPHRDTRGTDQSSQWFVSKTWVCKSKSQTICQTVRCLKQWLKKTVWRGEGWQRSRQRDSVSLDCGQTIRQPSEKSSISVAWIGTHLQSAAEIKEVSKRFTFILTINNNHTAFTGRAWHLQPTHFG